METYEISLLTIAEFCLQIVYFQMGNPFRMSPRSLRTTFYGIHSDLIPDFFRNENIFVKFRYYSSQLNLLKISNLPELEKLWYSKNVLFEVIK